MRVAKRAGCDDVRAVAALTLVAAVATPAVADPTSGIDGALFRSSYDSNGVFAVEGARLLPVHDLSFEILSGFGLAPVDLPVPGIGRAAGDTASDRVIDRLFVLDMAFGMTVTSRFAIGLDVAAYRASTGPGYGVRGRYATGNQVTPSSGLIALRPISNIDPSASPGDASAYLGDGLAGPLDARFGGKLALIERPNLAITAIGSVWLPFGEDEMLLGDRGLVFEPALATEWRSQGGIGAGVARVPRLRVVANLAARIRHRTVLESFDVQDPMATDADARAFLDVGSETVLGVGAVLAVTPRLRLAIEAQGFAPLPDAMSWGDCRRYDGRRCSTLGASDYFADARRGDPLVLATAGVKVRATADVTLEAMASSAQLGARGDALRFTAGLVWAPQPLGSSMPGEHDRDGDGVPDTVDGCPAEPEDRDGYQDEDGCIDADNDRDGIPDATDKCPDDAEDRDGFEDADGCPELDNDGDGVVDAIDRCPLEPEDRDNFEDEDGCADPDNDQDGVPDASDRCPNDAGAPPDGCSRGGAP